MLVSLAGPGMNILLAFIGMIILKWLLPYQAMEWGQMAIALLYPLIQINLILAAFNLIPVPPLDGAKILAGLLPDRGAALIYQMEQYGMLILLLLIVTGITGKILWPLANFMYGIIYTIVF